MNEPAGSILEHFGRVSDPRIDRRKLHKLLDIIGIAVCAVICGADGWVDVEIFGKSKEKWLRGFLELPNGVPSHDTFGRVFGLIDRVEFENGFLSWVQAIQQVTGGQVLALDGKQLRRSHDLLKQEKTLRAGIKAKRLLSGWDEDYLLKVLSV